MNLTPDRQGYLGDLTGKSTAELKELLERQEKILSKRKFADTLPDKGEKAKAFVACLRHLIEQRTNDLSSSSVYTKSVMVQISDLHQKPSSVDSSFGKFPDTCKLDDAGKNEFNGQNQFESDIKRSDSDHSENITDGSNSLVSTLEKMSLGGSKQVNQTDTGQYINSYERVIKQAESKTVHKKKFLPNRTLIHDHIPPSPYPHNVAPKHKGREDESAANLPCYKFQKSQLIAIEESVKLIEQQRALNEELITQRAARKLADHLTPKMGIYAPSSTDMQYRETVNTDQDSDDEANDDDVTTDDDADTDVD